MKVFPVASTIQKAVAAAAATLVIATSAQAEVRIATVDVARILNESTEAKAKRAELDTANLEAKKKLEAKQSALKDLEGRLKQGKLSEDSKEFQQYKNQARDFENFYKDTTENLQRQFYKVNKTLTEKAVGLIRIYAEKHKIDLVLDKGAKERGPVLFGTNAADITNDILREMNS